MKTLSLRAAAVSLLLFIPMMSLCQVVEENFSYTAGSLLTAHGYVAHSGSGANPITVSAGNLAYAGYPSSGIGNSVILTGGSGSREDVNRTFSSLASGSVYASFLVSVATVSVAGDYFFHLAPPSVSTIFRGRVLVKSNASGQLSFGTSKSSSADSLIRWTPFSYLTGETYLIIMKYTFNGGSSPDDEVRLWVNPPLSTTEPPPNLIQTDNGSDVSALGSFVLRQGSASYNLTLDGLRISTSWNNARLPLQLATFTATAGASGTIISWTTISETDTYGFEVQKSISRSEGYQSISGFIPGHGTTTQPQSYSFRDTSGIEGRFYRLKETDLDQSVYFSEPTEAGTTSVTVVEPFVFGLSQNYPNPFNPTTTIRYELAAAGWTTLVVYTLIGNEVAKLIDGGQDAGSHLVTWNAGRVSSGVYFIQLTSGGRTEIRRMVVLR